VPVIDLAALKLDVLGGVGKVQLAARLTNTPAASTVGEGTAKTAWAKKLAMAATEVMEMKTIVNWYEREVLEEGMQKEREKVLMGLLYTFEWILYSKRNWNKVSWGETARSRWTM
jgi:hypothetical protein